MNSTDGSYVKFAIIFSELFRHSLYYIYFFFFWRGNIKIACFLDLLKFSELSFEKGERNFTTSILI